MVRSARFEQFTILVNTKTKTHSSSFVFLELNLRYFAKLSIIMLLTLVFVLLGSDFVIDQLMRNLYLSILVGCVVWLYSLFTWE